MSGRELFVQTNSDRLDPVSHEESVITRYVCRSSEKSLSESDKDEFCSRHLKLLPDLPAADVPTASDPRNTLYPADTFFDLLSAFPGNAILLRLLSFLKTAPRQRVWTSLFGGRSLFCFNAGHRAMWNNAWRLHHDTTTAIVVAFV